MIITEQKPLDEIMEILDAHSAVLLIGCPICATTWATGGERELSAMREELEAAGKRCVGTLMPDESTCDRRLTRLKLRRSKEALAEADAVLVFSCGAGVQTVADLVDVPTYPGINTLFLARLQSLTASDERCRMCGDCVLAETASICPVTLCPKGLANGPCGGYVDGKCEVDREQDCAWVLIYERLHEWGQGERFVMIRQPKDWSRARHPASVDKRALVSAER
jgi:hypothetical protein